MVVELEYSRLYQCGATSIPSCGKAEIEVWAIYSRFLRFIWCERGPDGVALQTVIPDCTGHTTQHGQERFHEPFSGESRRDTQSWEAGRNEHGLAAGDWSVVSASV